MFFSVALCAPGLVLAQAGTETYTYDARGRVTIVAYPNGITISYAYDAAGNRTQVQTADTSPSGAPGTPTYTNIRQTSATVSYTAATPDSLGIASYEYELNSGAWISVGNVLSFNLTGLTASTTYTVKVNAVDNGGYAGATSSSSLTTLPNPPGAPGTPTFSSITSTTATISWTAASGTVTSYAYSLNNGSTWTSVGTALTASLTGLSPSTHYTALVHASNTGGTGPNSSGTFTTASSLGTFQYISGTHTQLGNTGDIATATINNSGNGTITGISYSCSGGSWYNYGSPPTSLAAGASGSFTCQAAASGSYTVTFTLSGTNASNSPFTTPSF
jgi:YD repeat-containing protein